MNATWSRGLRRSRKRTAGVEDGTKRAGPDIHLIDGDDNLPSVRRRQVARVEALGLVGDLLLGSLDVYLDQLGRHHPPDFAVDLHGELRRAQIFDRPAAPIHDGDVDRNQIDAGLERRTLDRLFLLLSLGRFLLLFLRANRDQRLTSTHIPTESQCPHRRSPLTFGDPSLGVLPDTGVSEVSL